MIDLSVIKEQIAAEVPSNVNREVTAASLRQIMTKLVDFTGETADEVLETAEDLAENSAASAVSAANTLIEVLNQKNEIQLVSDSIQSLISAYAWYGVQWDTAAASPVLTRIGSLELHKNLPVQSRMRGCLLLDNGTVNYYLNPNDWSKKVNGAASNRSGTDGQVMIEIPAYYARFETVGTVRRAKISEFALPGFTLVPKMYVSAYEASLQRSTNKLSSVINTTTDYRGGNNTAGWDAETRTLLGRPVTNFTRPIFKSYARNRGSVNWNPYLYDCHKSLYWLYTIEYSNFNSQATYNSSLTVEGYRQGGLGVGVTTVNGTTWSAWNSRCPFVPCGHTDSIGNFTGIVDYVMPPEYGTLTVSVPRYRGIENVFGHIWKWTEGVNLKIQADGSGGLSEFYVQPDPSKFSDSLYTDYSFRGYLSRVEGFIKELIVGEYGEMLPIVAAGAGASSTTYQCDYFYTNIPVSGEQLRGLLLGGAADHGSGAGPCCSFSNGVPSAALSDFGSRLCFI